MLKPFAVARGGVAAAIVAVFAVGNSAGARDGFKLPPEVTPAMRAACESDVRRLCINDDSTVETVKQCVLANFRKLGTRCQAQIVLAGLAP